MWVLTLYLNAVLFLTQMPDGQRRPLRTYTETCMLPIKTFFPRTAGAMVRKKWIKQLRVIDSTTLTLSSNAIFKSVGRHPKSGKKKGGIKVHSVIHANEGVPCGVQFTSAATNDSFILAPSHYGHNEIIALDRAYISYDKFEELTERGWCM